MKKIVSAAIAALSIVGFSGVAHADCSSGFLANLACQTGIIDKQTANNLDAANAAAGQPVDNAIYRGMDYVYPGSGAAAQTYARLHQQGAFNGPQGPAPAPQGPAPQFAPGPFQGGQPGPFQPGGMPPMMMQQRFASVCVSQAGAVPMMNPSPVGMPCTAMTPYGALPGITQ